VTGTPDLAWPKRRVAVFVDSAWWHGHSSRWTPGRHPQEWDEKISRNRERDAEVNTALAEQGWTVLRVWDFDVERDLEGCVERVGSLLGGLARSR
jgi:DNA mismatch endonuclease (patch repair protein)